MVWHDELRHGMILRCELRPGEPTLGQTTPTFIDGQYCVRVDTSGRTTVDNTLKVFGLAPEAYHQETRRALRVQRLASYRHALANLTKYRPLTLAQLVGSTVRNKIVGLVDRSLAW